MARSPERREDLIADATAMPRRGELFWAGEPEACVIGFRASGAASVYFGEQPVIHFDELGRVRRLFDQNRQILARNGRLCVRLRGDDGYRMTGVDRPLGEADQLALLETLGRRLCRLLAAVAAGDARWGRTTIDQEVLQEEVLRLAQTIGNSLEIGSLS